MANIQCMRCGGTGFLYGGETPCPECSKIQDRNFTTVDATIPKMYRGRLFQVGLLPEDMQHVYGPFMENLHVQLTHNFSSVDINMLIATRPNTGKTVWAYSIIRLLRQSGLQIPNVMDIMEVRNYLNRSYTQEPAGIFKSPLLFVKIPHKVESYMYDDMGYLIDRRGRNDARTIFLYEGSLESLRAQDTFKSLASYLGTGEFNTIKVYTFYS